MPPIVAPDRRGAAAVRPRLGPRPPASCGSPRTRRRSSVSRTSTPTGSTGLYVAPDRHGPGVGSALLEVVKAVRPDGFGLWVFESNTPARDVLPQARPHRPRAHRRLRQHGARTRRQDGLAGADPLAFYRGLIDDVDAQLGDLLARRVALTRAVQDHKRAPPAAWPAPSTATRAEREIAHGWPSTRPSSASTASSGSCT